MMTALMIFMGLSACATSAIVASVIVGARRSNFTPAPVRAVSEQTESSGATGILPAYSA